MKQPKTTLEQWAVFTTVVDEGSFAKAAEALNKSQSAVSYIIGNLNN
ncbi:MAG: LysR family transcriptional regulator, partial [Gammaproteobacteria bacterium]